MDEKSERELILKFIQIAKRRWIKGVNNFSNSVGMTFESLLDKKPDSLYFPDYYGIEIKCSQRFSGYPISLFSLSFDGPRLYEMNRILTTYGEADVKFAKRYQLQTAIFVNRYSKFNNYYFKLKIDYELEKVFIEIYDLNYKLIESDVYIDFKTIKARLELKFSKLAMVYASRKKIDGDLYFRYYQITIYYLKSFEKFIDLLENDRIKMLIMGRVSRSGIEEGRQRNKNLIFYLPKENIEELFEKNIEYNNDLVK